MPVPDFQNLLVIKPTALGDVAQALLAVPKIKQARPACRLSWVVDEDYLPLVQACPAVDRAIPFPRRRWKQHCSPRDMLNWAAGLKNEGAEVALDLQGLARSALMGLASGAACRIGLASGREGSAWTYHLVVDDNQPHAVDRYLAAADMVAGGLPNLELSYLPPPASPLSTGLAAGGYTAVHPYSNWTSKLWNWGNYDPLFRLLPDEHFVLVGQGPFFPVAAPNVTDLRGRTSLASLLAILGHARCVISTDSGPLHIAAAFNRPLIGLFGATDPRKTGPRARKQIVLGGPPEAQPLFRDTYRLRDSGRALAGISISAVAEAWKALNI